MKLILYVLREYFKFVLGTTTVGVFLFVLFDFMHKTSKNYFSDFNSSTVEIFLLYFFQLPHQIIQTLPISALIASIITMVIFSRTNEVTVARAVGLGPMKISSPLIVGGVLLSTFALFLNLLVLPVSSKKMRYIQKVQIEGESDLEFSGSSTWMRNKNSLFNFTSYEPIYQKLEGVKLLDISDDFQINRMITAGDAFFDPVNRIWKMNQVVVLDFAKNGNLIFQKRLKNLNSVLPIEPNKLEKERREPDELSINELKSSIAKGEETGTDVLRQRISLHSKWAFPFASFFVSLLGLPFAFNSERKTESVKGILLSFLFGISYWFIYSASRAFGNLGYIPPFFAAWSGNIVLFLVVAFQFIKSFRK